MKRSVLAVVMAGILVLASPNPAWAYNRTFEVFKITRIPDGMMKVVVELGLREEQSPPDDCRNNVPVNVQRRINGRWRTRFSGRTNSQARFVRKAKRQRGRYRAVALEFTTDAGNQCFKAVSDPITFP